MLKRRNRFKGDKDIRRVYRVGSGARAELLGARFTPARGKGSRIVVVVSKKIHKSAVVRNRIRRRLYEAIRQNCLQDLTPVDLVLTVYDVRLATASWQEVERGVEGLLSVARSRTRQHQSK